MGWEEVSPKEMTDSQCGAQSEMIPQTPFLPPQWTNELHLILLLDAVSPLQCGSVGRSSSTRVLILPWRSYLGRE